MLCCNCFSELPTPGPCPRCGFDAAREVGKYPLALPPGSILAGQYITGRVLGQGGFGVTYLALDTRRQERVAIKEFLPDTMASRAAGTLQVTAFTGERGEQFRYGRERFLEEACTLAKFNGHPNIVGVRSYFEENGTAYFVMEVVEGVSLKERLAARGGRLPWKETHALLLPVMNALCDVHREGIIHRDVTPDNIVLTRNDVAKLLDFGAARYSLGDRSQSLDVVLKHGYAPKEQYTRRGRQGPYTDVYSLAATFYRCVTGFVPPDALDRMEEDELVLPSTRGIHMPVALEDALVHALEVSPADRFQTMEEFRAAVCAACSIVVPPPAPEPAPEPEPASQPEPVPQPEPAPQPVPQPAPEPEPAPQPEPVPDPEPVPEPAPEPRPQPVWLSFVRSHKWAAPAALACAAALILLVVLVIGNPGRQAVPVDGGGDAASLAGEALPLGGDGTQGGEAVSDGPGENASGLDADGALDPGSAPAEASSGAASEAVSAAEAAVSGEAVSAQESAAPASSAPAASSAASSKAPASSAAPSKAPASSAAPSKAPASPAQPAAVSFSDSVFAQCMAAGLKKDAGSITASDLAGISSLSIYRWNDTLRVVVNGTERDFDCPRGNAVTNLADLQKLTGCTSLSIADQSLSNLSPLSSMTQLRSLTLDNNGISSVSSLSSLTGLTSLSLEENAISDLSPLSSLTSLKTLNLRSNQISSVSALSGLTNLQQLDLWYNSVSDLSPLSGLKSMTFLDMGGNRVSNLSPLSGLTGLTKLTLSSNAISDISPLASLTNLEDLTLYGNQITDVSPLAGLTKLRSLRLKSNPIEDTSPLDGLPNLELLQVDG